MRETARFISRQTARFIPEKMLFRVAAPVFLPFYHTVTDRKLPYILNYPYRTVSQFETELDHFLRFFEPVSLGYLLKNPAPAKPVFHLSFDDGLREPVSTVLPILLKKGIPATFFINSGFAGNQKLFHRYKASLILTGLNSTKNTEAEKFLNEHNLNRQNILQTAHTETGVLDEAAKMLGIDFDDFLKKEKPYLSIEEIAGLQEKGFTIGAHSANHPEFYKLNEAEQLNEIKESIEWISAKFAPEIKVFSFPFTDDGISLKLLQKLSSGNICDITFGTAGLKYDECKTHFQRYPAEQPGNFRLNLKEEWMYFGMRKITGRAVVIHK